MILELNDLAITRAFGAFGSAVGYYIAYRLFFTTIF